MNSKIELYNDMLEDLRGTYIRKNNDYGDSVGDTYKKFGDISFLVRIADKYNRIETLANPKNKQQVCDESLDDTIQDLANYCLLWLVERKIAHPKPVKKKVDAEPFPCKPKPKPSPVSGRLEEEEIKQTFNYTTF